MNSISNSAALFLLQTFSWIIFFSELISIYYADNISDINFLTCLNIFFSLFGRFFFFSSSFPSSCTVFAFFDLRFLKSSSGYNLRKTLDRTTPEGTAYFNQHLALLMKPCLMIKRKSEKALNMIASSLYTYILTRYLSFQTWEKQHYLREILIFKKFYLKTKFAIIEKRKKK